MYTLFLIRCKEKGVIMINGNLNKSMKSDVLNNYLNKGKFQKISRAMNIYTEPNII